MRRWLKDSHFRTLLKNSTYLAASQIVAAIAGILTVAAAGRALGLEMFGMLVLINSYVQAASGISKFQSWQLIVRYGGKALSLGETGEFEAATRFAFGLDLASGLVGTVAAIALLPILGQVFGISVAYTTAAMLYCLLLPTTAGATPVGVLRSLHRFDLISWQATATPILRATLALFAWSAHLGFEAFLAIWFASALAGDLFLWFLAWRELQRRDLRHGFRPTLRPRGLQNAWRFAIHVNLNSTLQTASGPIGRLIVGGLLGASGAALYQVASSLTTAVQKPADLLLKAYYPQIVGMDFASKTPWKFMVRAAGLTGMIAVVAVLVLILGGHPLIRLIFGEQFVGAYLPLLVLAAVPLFAMISFPVAPMLYSLDRPEVPVRSLLAGTLVYFGAVAPMTWRFGLAGAAAAFVVGNVVTVSSMAWSLFGEYRRLRGHAERKVGRRSFSDKRQSP
jgi:O-antigen/teichoic acid export membrane protein